MASLTKSNIDDIGVVVGSTLQVILPAIIEEIVPPIVRKIIQEEVPPLVRKIIQEEVPPLVRKIIQEEVTPMIRTIVRTETADIKSDILLIREVLSVQGIAIRSMQIDMSQLKNTVRGQGVLYEDLNDRFIADSELLRKNFMIKDQVDDHGNRIGKLELGQDMLKRVAREHSRRLNIRSS